MEILETNHEKKKGWKQYYERLLNVLRPSPVITQAMVEKPISKMKKGKAPGPSGVVTEMLKASSDVCSKIITDPTNCIIRDNTMCCEWNGSITINLFKDKVKL